MPPKYNKRLEGDQQQAGSKPPLHNTTPGLAQPPVQANTKKKRNRLKPCARIQKDVLLHIALYVDDPSVGGFFRAEKVRDIPESVQRQYTDDVLETLLNATRCSDCGCKAIEHHERLVTYHVIPFNGATEIEEDHDNPPQFTPDGLQAMKDRLIHVMDYRMEVEEKYNTHIPRFVEALRPQVVSRQHYISHIYGESGAGKTWASLDIVEAFYKAEVRFSVQYYFAHSLYDVDLEDPYDADGTRDAEVFKRRNAAALEILVSMLQEPSEENTVLIFDECQSRPQLCRGIAASIGDLEQHYDDRTKFYCYFIGLNYVHNANTTFSPPDSVKHQLFPIVPSANGEFATKLLETTSECDHVEDKFRLFCGGNAAATVFVADQLRRVGPSDAVGIAKRAILYLLQRNSVLRLRLSHHAALTTVRLLTAGVVLLTPATEPFLRLGLVTVNESPPIATRRDHSTSSVNEWPQLSRQPTSTDDFALEDDDQQQQQLDREDGCVELDLANKDDEIPISQLVQIPADRRTTQSARTATLTVNPCYLHYYFALLGRQTSVRMNSQRFQEVAMWWVCDRLSAAEYLAARLGRAEVTYKDIFPFAIGSDTLLAERVPRSTEVLPESQSTGARISVPRASGWPCATCL